MGYLIWLWRHKTNWDVASRVWTGSRLPNIKEYNNNNNNNNNNNKQKQKKPRTIIYLSTLLVPITLHLWNFFTDHQRSRCCTYIPVDNMLIYLNYLNDSSIFCSFQGIMMKRKFHSQRQEAGVHLNWMVAGLSARKSNLILKTSRDLFSYCP